MQQNPRNLIVTVVLCFAVMFGWQWLSVTIWPPQLTAKARQDLGLHLMTASPGFGPAGGGVADAVRVAASGALTMPERTFKSPPPEAKAAEAVAAEPDKPEPPAPPAETIDLGGDEYHLSVRLTTRGGAVERVVLNHFQQADWYGLPVKDKETGKKVPLHLVPRTDGRSSYVLYHYDKPNDPRPLDTLARQPWRVTRPLARVSETRQEVELACDLPSHGVRFVKAYTLEAGAYHVGLSVRVEPLPGAKPEPVRYQIEGAHGLPIEGVWYTTVYRNALAGWVDKGGTPRRYMADAGTVGFTEGSNRLDRNSAGAFNYAAVAVQYFASAVVVSDEQPDKKANFVEFVRATHEARPRPKGGDRDKMTPEERAVDDERLLAKDRPYLEDVTVRMISEPVAPEADKPVRHDYLLYNGPLKVRLLNQLKNDDGSRAVAPELVDRYEHTLHLNTMTDYASPNFVGDFSASLGWSWLLIKTTNLMHWLLGNLYALVPVLGVCVILLTVVVRGALFPLSRKQAKNMAELQVKMQAIKPQLEEIQRKHGDDVMLMRQKQMELYRRHNVNPMSSLGGCFMLLLQMPIFMGLYYALQESIFFRLSPFLWMPNLAAPDMLLWWTESIPLLSVRANLGEPWYLGPYFNILPVIAIVLMMVHQKMVTPPPTDDIQAQQIKMMKFMMILFGIMFYKVPAGLTMYFIASTLWGITERKLIGKPAAPTPGTPGPAPVPAPFAAGPRTSGPAGGGKGKKKGKGKGKAGPAANGVDPNSKMGKLKSYWEKILEEAKKKER